MLAVFLPILLRWKPTEEIYSGRKDMLFLIARLCLKFIKPFSGFFLISNLKEPILCHHNYVSEETHFGEDVIVTRKGAISA